MLLAIDSGNTNVVFALMDAGAPVAQWRLEAQDRRTADEYYVWLSQIMQLKGYEPRQISAVIIANVRPASSFALERLSQQHLGHEPLVVGRAGGPDLGLDIRIDQPAQLGADRIVNAFLAKQLGLCPAIIIDTGTATTFDLIAGDGAYVGGVIAPGVHVSAQALADAAAQLPLVPVEMPNSPIGTNTRSAMQSGLFWGYVAMLEGMIARLKVALNEEGHSGGAPVRVIGTGGLMKILSKGLPTIDEVDADFTLRGLAHIYDKTNSA